MTKRKTKKNYFQKMMGFFILGAAVLIAHIFLGSQSIKKMSPGYDELVHLSTGYLYFEHDGIFQKTYGHTPLARMWAAIPLLFLNPNVPDSGSPKSNQSWHVVQMYRFADQFFYQNKVPWKKMLTLGRSMNFLWSLMLGVILVLIGWKQGGFSLGCWMALLWGFSPTLLAHSTLITTDLAFCLFYFLFFASLLFQKRTIAINVMSGVFLGACFGTKFASLVLIPSGIILLLIATKVWHGNFSHWKPSIMTWIKKYKNDLGVIMASGLVIIIFIFQIYGATAYWTGLKDFLFLTKSGYSTFLMGETSQTGWIHYYLIVFLIKTPIPLLIAIGISGYMIIKKKMDLPPLLWVPPLVYFVVISFSNIQLGQRYLLPLYPFLILLGAKGLRALSQKKMWMALTLACWYVVGSLHASPHFLSFFNEFIGGAKNGYKYLTDSNVDWGQGLEELSDQLEPKDKQNGIYLCYFGVGDPHAYGISYLSVLSDYMAGHHDDEGKPGLGPTKFAISVTNLQGTYYSNKDLFQWVKTYTPWKKVANSIFVYDFSKDPDAIKKLETYRRKWRRKK